ELQRPLDERVGQPAPVVAPILPVEMPDIPARVLAAVELEDPLHLGHRGALGRRRTPPPIPEAVVTGPFEALPPPPHGARRDPEDARRLNPADRPADRPHDDFPHPHGPLPGQRREPLRPIPHGAGLYAADRLERTPHLLSGADRSCAPYMSSRRPLTLCRRRGSPPDPGPLMRRQRS